MKYKFYNLFWFAKKPIETENKLAFGAMNPKNVKPYGHGDIIDISDHKNQIASYGKSNAVGKKYFDSIVSKLYKVGNFQSFDIGDNQTLAFDGKIITVYDNDNRIFNEDKISDNSFSLQPHENTLNIIYSENDVLKLGLIPQSHLFIK